MKRLSHRYRAYDYSQVGFYFVTICVHERKHLFGYCKQGIMTLTTAGQIAQTEWLGLEKRFPAIMIDQFIFMPDHMHGIVVLRQYPDANCEQIASKDEKVLRLGSVIRTYKSVVTSTIRASCLTNFGWQPNYHDHIIRNEKDLQTKQNYIIENPIRWRDPDSME